MERVPGKKVFFLEEIVWNCLYKSSDKSSGVVEEGQYEKKCHYKSILNQKKKLKETIQVAAINQNRTVAEEKHIEDEIPGASTHRQNFKNW